MIPRYAPLKRSAPRRRRKGGPRRGPANIPASEFRNKRYRDFLGKQGLCRACQVGAERGYPTDNPHGYWAGFDEGRCVPMHGPALGKSMKGPDSGCIPGCSWHHAEQHAIQWEQFCEKYGFDRAEESAKWWAKFTGGK